MNARNPSPTEALVTQFLDRSLPKAEWTHAAHLRVGLWHVLNTSPESALERLREGISRLNESHGTPNTDRGGYHETITRFYVAIIERFVARCDRSRPLDELADRLVVQCDERDLPLRYYSRALLDSVPARRGWVEPDLRPLD